MFIEINKEIKLIDLENNMNTINYDQSRLRQQELQIEADKERQIVAQLRQKSQQRSLLDKVLDWIVFI
jgi:hypothetical protein